MGVILVAYERESEQVALEQLLSSRGHQVVRSHNGLAALDAARREPPHLVVADIVLPRMDGFALCRKWKQDERLRSIPFIFYTRRHDDPKYERFALELGAEKFFARTTQPEALAAAVDEYLANAPSTSSTAIREAAQRGAAVDETALQRAQALAVQKAMQAQAIVQQKLEHAHAAALQKVEQDHTQALAKLRSEQEQAAAQAKADHERGAAKLEEAHQQALSQAQAAHESALERAQETHGRLRSQIEEMETAQQRIAAGEARFRRVFEANPLPMWMADHATHGFIAVNDAALTLYGYKRAEFLALTTRGLEADHTDPLIEGAGAVTHRTKSGASLHVALTSQEIEFDGRNADLVCASNLTQRIELEAAQVKKAENARSQLDALGDGYLAIDSNDKILDVNAAYCRMTGYTREQLLKMSLPDVEQGNVGDTTARLQFVAMDGVHRHETRHKRVDGSLLDVEVSVGPLGNATNGNTTVLVRDVTQRRREIAAQRGAQRQLEFLVDLFKQADAFDESAIVRRVIEQASDLTGSPLAYLFFVEPTSKTMTLAAWRDRSQGQVTMTSAAEPRPLSKSGLFTECVKGKHPTSSNDLSWKPQMDGLPDLQRYLAVPMLSEDQAVAVLGVANRDAGYSEEDQRALTAMADGVWRVLQAKRSHVRTLISLQRTDVALQGMIESFVKMVERHDPFTAGSARRIAQLAVALAREAGLDGEHQHTLRVAALLHDIGNITVPAAILAKPGALTGQEIALMRTHAEEGCKLIADINFGAPVAEVVFEHHERLDGSGYPRGLKGDEISADARILAIADTVEAMCSPRPHRPALGMEAAIEELNKNAGKLYDLHFVTACTRLVRQRGFSF